MTELTALAAARIFDAERWHDDAALLMEGSHVTGIVPRKDVPASARLVEARGRIIAPGFVDLQVNGGGGCQFNDAPDHDTIARIAGAHRAFGTTALLPTLITDTPETTARAIRAAAGASRSVPGCLGLHLEGPHLSLARKGAHDARLIRPMQEADLDALVDAARLLPVLMVTLAPESVSAEQVGRLAQTGIRVSLGHSDCDFETASAYARAGARLVTHLFNAMSPLGHREPGLAGAALALPGLSAGLIADGIHVADPVAALALRAKAGPGKIFLVTDAMAPLGSKAEGFTLNGREIARRRGADGIGRLTLADGTLAGADIDMAASVARLVAGLGIALDEALRMASLYPAEAIDAAQRKGRLAPGHDADIVELDETLKVRGTWIGGSRFYPSGEMRGARPE
ncbi:N-acetylglucosamine-6-phosphate deacetylase [Stappia sp.]|uniref:N-acetylglucosamine-6-phosphate deacetylase n=1 Tax=Stappia sp. TaxID=1870903 RepID=UPI003D0A7107